ncbi:acetoin utilization protein AcuB [Pedobacter sp. UYP30]|uniref:CBS domain-containing protein n=1 Tax=Pedobacter sp. UYP30 TaxID=1756400 RepID=UPI0033929AD7
MFAEELISNQIPSLKPEQTVQVALDRLNEFKLKHLAVVNKGVFLGLLMEEDLLEVADHSVKVVDIPSTLINAFVLSAAHTYDVIRLMSQMKLTAVPVLDQQKKYLGVISINDVIDAVGEQFAVTETGGIIVLEIGNRDNSLAHIAQIVEADNAQVLSSSVNAFADTTRLELTLKINKTDITGLVASFERYNYHVKEVYNNIKIDDGSQERFDSFMNYLNV